MKPYNMPSNRMKLLPWYYTERKAPSRWLAKRKAIISSIKESA